MPNNRFAKGFRAGGVFACHICGRKTRHAGQQETFCPQCDEWTQTENGIVDGCYDSDPKQKVEAEKHVLSLKQKAAALGGNPVKLGIA